MRRDAVAGAAERLLGLPPVRFGSAAELCGSAGPAALLVAAPAAEHVAIAVAAAAADVPALVEKPVAPDRAGALELAALEPAPWIGFNRRFLQGAELAGRVPAQGWIELDLELRYRRRSWRSYGSGDDALLDAGSHLIDLALWLGSSEPLAVRAASLRRERADLVLDLGRGRARISCATDRAHRERVVVRDRAGRLLARHALGPLRTRADSARGRGHPLVRSLAAELEALERELRSGGAAGSPLAGAAAGVRVMSVIEAAGRSAAVGGAEVTVARTDAGVPA